MLRTTLAAAVALSLAAPSAALAELYVMDSTTPGYTTLQTLEDDHVFEIPEGGLIKIYDVGENKTHTLEGAFSGALSDYLRPDDVSDPNSVNCAQEEDPELRRRYCSEGATRGVQITE